MLRCWNLWLNKYENIFYGMQILIFKMIECFVQPQKAFTTRSTTIAANNLHYVENMV